MAAVIEKLKNYNNKEVTLSVAGSCWSKNWKNKTMTWGELKEKLSNPVRTNETLAEYNKATKEEKGRIKDVGGFVGGHLKGGKRLSGNVICRTLVTLDIDFAGEDIWDLIEMMYDFTVIMYSTHSHTPKTPRYRLVIPIDRPVNPDEYEAIARKIADRLDMDLFDDTTYQPERLMYWPSCSSDADYEFKIQEGEWLNADSILAEYTWGWEDATQWPESSRVLKRIKSNISKQQDPLEKKNIIGTFCRAYYPIQDCIEELLSDKYEQGKNDTRYTYIEGSTGSGAVIYEDKFIHSHHGSDPISGMTCNAWDLVRMHKFYDAEEEKDKSEERMKEFALGLEKVKVQMIKDRKEEAMNDFDEVEDEEDVEEYQTRLKMSLMTTARGLIMVNQTNLYTIITKDYYLKDNIVFDVNKMNIVLKSDMPWRKVTKDDPMWEDRDKSGCLGYIEREYGLMNTSKYFDLAISDFTNKHRVHPIKDYLNSLPEWDREKRIEGLFQKFYKADDTAHTRMSAKKIFAGAVARILYPGCKFDMALILVGPQGTGKSSLFRELMANEEWFGEVKTIDEKKSIEAMLGRWVIELAELEAMGKSEQAAVKSFITTQETKIRMAYAKNSVLIKRQSVFIGTTNDYECLKDPTGSRRFLVVRVNNKQGEVNPEIFEMTQEYKDQIWAEALAILKEEGNKALYLSAEETKMVEKHNRDFRDVDSEESTVEEYLNTKLPSDWYELSIDERRDFFVGDITSRKVGEDYILREKVCIKELMFELYGINKIEAKESYRFKRILEGLEDWNRHPTSLRIKGYGTQRGFTRK